MKCKIRGCGRTKIKARGMCNKHLGKFYLYGNPLYKIRGDMGDGCVRPDGYKQITINGKCILEHRYVMEQYLGRKLLPFPNEEVHHIDGNKLNNKIENLQLTNASLHAIHHHTKYPVINGKKECSKCHLVLFLHRFSKGKSSGKKLSICKTCQNIYNVTRLRNIRSRN